MLSVSTAMAFENPLNFPEGWRLNRSGPDAAGMEYRIIDDAAGAYEGKSYVYLKGHLVTDNFIYVAEGDELNVSFFSKNPEGKDVSVQLYAYEQNKQGRLSSVTQLKVTTQKPGTEWTKIEGKITIPAKTVDKRINGIKVALVSKTGAYVDYAKITHVRTPEWKNYQDAFLEAGRKESKGNFSGALKDYSAAVKLANTEEEKKEAALKAGEMEKRLNRDSGKASIEEIFERADAFLQKGNYAEARREYDKIKELKEIDYSMPLALFNIAESYRLQKDYTNTHKTFNQIFAIPKLAGYYRIHGLFTQAGIYTEQNKYDKARQLYQQILNTEGALEYHLLKAQLFIGDTFKAERKHRKAVEIYRSLLRQQETSEFPNENFRIDLAGRLDSIAGLADGMEEKSARQKRIEWVNSPKRAIYVSLNGSDKNAGTKEKPFETIQRAREEVRKIKSNRMPEGGIAVYLRSGKYFINDTISFDKDDSGTDGSPVVYRSYPGEEVRIIGGRQVTDFKLLSDPEILKKLPEEARGKVWVTDLKKQGIADYGKLLPRGHSYPYMQAGAMELLYNTKPMQLARWPKEGWEKVADLVTPEGDEKVRGASGYVQKGRFTYSGNRPERWKEEKNIMVAGYFLREWDRVHYNVASIDTDEKIINLEKDNRFHKSNLIHFAPVMKDTPYYFYNILSELSSPGEFYIDRDAGKLYFYPPGKIQNSEIIVSTLNSSVINIKEASNVALYGLTLEGTWQNAIEMSGGRNNLIAGNTIRNTGILGILISGGWNHGVVGCDIYDTGEGGIKLTGGNVEKLVPGCHYVENNHIYRFNRFSFGGGKFAISMFDGTGNRAAHNLIYDAPYLAVAFSGNDNIIEYNEIYDVMHEAQDGGAVYNHNGQAYLRGRGNVMRYNFIHHISTHTSPTRPSLAAGITIDGFNGGMTMEGNVFYRNAPAIFTHGPDTRIENNFFIENAQGIAMGRRLLLDHTQVKRLLPTVEMLFTEAGYKQPPWNYRYPQAVRVFEDTLPLGKTENNIVERNVNRQGFFLQIPLSINVKKSIIRNNWDQGDPFFMDAKNMDFTLRPGSPAFGICGVEPVPFENIGLYKDQLRASWPVEKAPAGKYYRADKVLNRLDQQDTDPMTRRFPPLKRISEAREYQVKKRTSPITVDGKLDISEWMNPDKSKAMLIEENHLTGKTREGARSYAWLLFDDNYLYIGIENCPDQWREGLEKLLPSSLNEITIEGIFGKDTPWWEKDMPIGPLYTFSGHSDGNFKIHDLYGMPQESAELIQKSIEYKTSMLDPATYHWTSEWKIPFSALSMSVKDISSLKFNIGGPKRGGWICWVATGSGLWRVDNAGTLRFR